MSFRFARIKVVTRSKSPMMFLLSSKSNRQSCGGCASVHPEPRRGASQPRSGSQPKHRQHRSETVLNHERQLAGKMRENNCGDHHSQEPEHQQFSSPSHVPLRPAPGIRESVWADLATCPDKTMVMSYLAAKAAPASVRCRQSNAPWPAD